MVVARWLAHLSKAVVEICAGFWVGRSKLDAESLRASVDGLLGGLVRVEVAFEEFVFLDESGLGVKIL